MRKHLAKLLVVCLCIPLLGADQYKPDPLRLYIPGPQYVREPSRELLSFVVEFRQGVLPADVKEIALTTTSREHLEEARKHASTQPSGPGQARLWLVCENISVTRARSVSVSYLESPQKATVAKTGSTLAMVSTYGAFLMPGTVEVQAYLWVDGKVIAESRQITFQCVETDETRKKLDEIEAN